MPIAIPNRFFPMWHTASEHSRFLRTLYRIRRLRPLYSPCRAFLSGYVNMPTVCQGAPMRKRLRPESVSCGTWKAGRRLFRPRAAHPIPAWRLVRPASPVSVRTALFLRPASCHAVLRLFLPYDFQFRCDRLFCDANHHFTGRLIDGDSVHHLDVLLDLCPVRLIGGFDALR